MQNNMILSTLQNRARFKLYKISDSVYFNQDLITKHFLRKLCFDVFCIDRHTANVLKIRELQEYLVIWKNPIAANDDTLEIHKNIKE